MGSEDATNESSYRPVTIGTTDGNIIAGKINIAEYSRVSNLFLCPEPFVILIDVVSRDGEQKMRIINKAHISWVEPDD